MKKSAIVAAVVGAVAFGSLAGAPSATARDSFSFSFNTGDVAFAFSDGYWDRDHHWHRWHNSREAREYRHRFGDHYYARRHTAFRNEGWADFDHDGVPNRLDDAPFDPHRR